MIDKTDYELDKSIIQNELLDTKEALNDTRGTIKSLNIKIRQLVDDIKSRNFVGDKGEKGEKGNRGNDGNDGKDGKAGKNGTRGSKGLTGAKGKDGITEVITKEVTKPIEEVARGLEDLPDKTKLDATKTFNKESFNKLYYSYWQPQGGGDSAQAGGDSDKVSKSGDTMTGALDFLDDDTGETGSISIVDDAGTVGGKVFQIESVDGVLVDGSYVVIKSQNLTITKSGAQVGSPLIVAGIDSLGGAIMGWGVPSTTIYNVTATTETPVVIKAAGAGVPTGTVLLGLSITLTEDLPSGTAGIIYEIPITNTANKWGELEIGVNVNGTDVYRGITKIISAKYTQSIASAVPILSDFASGDVIELIARVVDQQNAQFNLTMNASAGATGKLNIHKV